MDSVEGFLTHFLRKEYGTFRLYSGNENKHGEQLSKASHRRIPPSADQFRPVHTSAETGIVLPKDQRQHITSHAPKVVLPLRICAHYCEGRASLRFVLFTVHRVSCPCEMFRDGFDLHLLQTSAYQ